MSFEFDSIDPIATPVRIGSTWYALCEPSDATVRAFRNAGMAGLTMDFSDVDPTSPESIKDSLAKAVKGIDPDKMKSAEAILVAGCLKHCKYDEEAKAITEIGDVAFTSVEVDAWPHRIMRPLFQEAKRIGELDKLVKDNPFQVAGQNTTKT